MKANETPEKLYLFEDPISGTPDYRWLSKRSDDNDIEYTRTDAFIEKAVNYLNCNLSGVVAIKDGNITQGLLRTKSEFIKDFKKFMEGE